MSITNIVSAYNDYYNKNELLHVYPVEFVVRTFLGRYPHLALDKSKYVGNKILDLGYGDGRNMPLLSNLGFKVFGVEISDEINRVTKNRLQALGIPAELKTGHNSFIPYPDNYFQTLLACHACYYVAEDQTFTDNLNEMSRVLESNGMFVASLPFRDSYILDNAEVMPDGHFRIQNDPYGLRNGTIFRAFNDEEEIKQALGDYFTDFRIGFCNDNFYGIHQKVWIVTCWKK